MTKEKKESLKKPALSQSEVHALLKSLDGGDMEDEFDMPDLGEGSKPEFNSKQLEQELDKLLIRFLHPDAHVKEVKRIGFDVYSILSNSWKKAQQTQNTLKKINECFKER